METLRFIIQPLPCMVYHAKKMIQFEEESIHNFFFIDTKSFPPVANWCMHRVYNIEILLNEKTSVEN